MDNRLKIQYYKLRQLFADRDNATFITLSSRSINFGVDKDYCLNF